MPYILSKTPKSKPPVQTRLCLHCNQTYPLTKFFSNKDWVENGKKDKWCKNCVAKIQTKDEMRRYFWENNRQWKENVWENAIEKAKLEASKSAVYQKSNEDRKNILLEHIACSIMPELFRLTQNYQYEEHLNDPHTNSYDEAKENGKITETKDKNIKTYNEFFNGEFKELEIEYLENYYNGLQEDFDLSDTALRDTAKKVAKASLMADKVQNDYMAGRCSLQDVKDATAQLDLLMKTGNFAACKRKPGDKNTLNNWAETTMYCETHGYPCVKPIDWPKDVVDMTIESLNYVVESLREDEGDAI